MPQRHTWPGNVRELENVDRAGRARSRRRRPSSPSACPSRSLRPSAGIATPSIGHGFSLDGYLLSVEAKLLQEALQQAAGDRAEAARLLGVTPRSLRYLLKKHPSVADKNRPA